MDLIERRDAITLTASAQLVSVPEVRVRNVLVRTVPAPTVPAKLPIRNEAVVTLTALVRIASAKKANATVENKAQSDAGTVVHAPYH